MINTETEGLKVEEETYVCIRRVRFLKGTFHVNLNGHPAKGLHVNGPINYKDITVFLSENCSLLVSVFLKKVIYEAYIKEDISLRKKRRRLPCPLKFSRQSI